MWDMIGVALLYEAIEKIKTWYSERNSGKEISTDNSSHSALEHEQAFYRGVPRYRPFTFSKNWEIYIDQRFMHCVTDKVIPCVNYGCRKKLVIPDVQEERLLVTCPVCRKNFHYPQKGDYKKRNAYLDIESTSLDPNEGELTVVGIGVEYENENKIIQIVGRDINREKILESIVDVDVLYTYNGKKFDLPYIEAKTGVNLRDYCIHRDLMYGCFNRGLFGGLKKVEKELNISRRFSNVSPVDLWRKYKVQGDKNALTTLLEYNKEDFLNLQVLKEKLLKMNQKCDVQRPSTSEEGGDSRPVYEMSNEELEEFLRKSATGL